MTVGEWLVARIAAMSAEERTDFLRCLDDLQARQHDADEREAIQREPRAAKAQRQSA